MFGEDRTATEKVTDAIVLHRVKRGIALLEEAHGPDWASKIDLDELRLCEAECCVLGQVYDDWAVTEEQAEGYRNSVVGNGEWIDDGSDGFTKGLAIIDGPLIEQDRGPTKHGFVDGETLYLDELAEKPDGELAEEYGVTRAMVDEAIAEAAEAGEDPHHVWISYGYDELDNAWKPEIAARQ